jgi:ribosomal protein L11 methyltransferase
VLDVGTGSGVLAIAAARLGLAPVLGLDNEQESVVAAEENARVNGFALQTQRYDLRTEPLPWFAAGSAAPSHVIVLANLLRPLLLELVDAIEREPPRVVIAGGLLVGELDEIAAAFSERHGMRERRRRIDGEWGSLWLQAADRDPNGTVRISDADRVSAAGSRARLPCRAR